MLIFKFEISSFLDMNIYFLLPREIWVFFIYLESKDFMYSEYVIKSNLAVFSFSIL